MSSTDNYSFKRSMLPQSMDEFTPMTNKQFNFVNDINNGIYTNTTGTSLISYDLSSIFNSSQLTNTSDCFIVLPITMVAAFSTNAGVLQAPAAGVISPLMTLKTGNLGLIHQCDLQINGKTIEQTQPFTGMFKSWQQATMMGQDDLNEIGKTLGFSTVLDSYSSVVYNAGAAGTGSGAACSPGLYNNLPYGVINQYSTSNQLTAGKQNAGCINQAIQQRIAWTADTTNNYNNVYPALVKASQLYNEFKPSYQVINGYGVWYDYIVIRMCDLFDSMNNINFTRRFDAVLRLYVNTGLLQVAVGNPNTTGTNYTFAPANSTFTNTCPFTLNVLDGQLPATTTLITAGFFVGKPPSYTLGGVNLGNSGANNPMNASRFYFSQIVLSPSKQLEFLESNRNKRVVFQTFIANNYNNISNSFNTLVQSGVVGLLGVMIVPLIAASVTGFSQYQSPFDTCGGCSFSPLSLTNLQVSIGGVNMLQSSFNYTFENYIEQIQLLNKLSTGDLGLSAGLISQEWWSMNRVYYVDCARSQSDDKTTPRNVIVSCNVNSNVAVDLLIYTIYADEFVIDCSTGIVSK